MKTKGVLCGSLLWYTDWCLTKWFVMELCLIYEGERKGRKLHSLLLINILSWRPSLEGKRVFGLFIAFGGWQVGARRKARSSGPKFSWNVRCTTQHQVNTPLHPGHHLIGISSATCSTQDIVEDSAKNMCDAHNSRWIPPDHSIGISSARCSTNPKYNPTYCTF